MSWLFSQALVEEYLVDTSLVGEQSVPLNGKNTPQAYCAPDKMTDFSRLSQFGMTYKPLTENLGEKLLMLFLEDFLAKTCQQQETEKDLTESEVDYGKRWGGLLAKLDQNSSLWKIPQCSLITDSTECLQTFPNWGLMRDGVLWEQTTLAHPTEGNDFGWWPTPVASDNMTGQTNGITYTGKRFVRTSQKTGTEFGAKLTSAYRLMTGKHLPANFSEWMMGWPQDWTELKPVETAKFQKWQQLHGEF
jgi:hypothetical protein